MTNPNYNKYTGARYVPLVDGEWSSTKAYEPLTVVTYQGASYTSKRYVPKGIPTSNTQYWVLTGNYNGQVEQYRQEVKDLEQQVNTDLTNVINNLNGKTNKADFTDFETLPYSPMPPKQGIKTNSVKLIRKVGNDEFIVIQKTNRGYLKYVLDTKNGDTSSSSVGMAWELVRLKKVERVRKAYAYLDLTPTTGTLDVFQAGSLNSTQENEYFGTPFNEPTSSDGTGNGFTVYSIPANGEVTFTIPCTYQQIMNVLFLSSNLSASSVDISVNDIIVKNINARAYRSATSGDGYATVDFSVPRNVYLSRTYKLKIKNNDSVNPFYYCCLNMCELKDYNNNYVNKFKYDNMGVEFIDAVGASDYAIFDYDIQKWCGSYHGGESRIYGRCLWKTLNAGQLDDEGHENFADITNGDWTIARNFVMWQKTKINNKATMVTTYDFNTDGTMEMKFALTDNTINMSNFYTALTCTGTTFNFISYPNIQAINLNTTNVFPNIMGEVVQYDASSLIELGIRYTQFNRYLSTSENRNPYILHNASYAKFYYGPIVASTTPTIIKNLCFEKGLDFTVRQ